MCLDAEGTFKCSVVVKITVNATFQIYSVPGTVFPGEIPPSIQSPSLVVEAVRQVFGDTIRGLEDPGFDMHQFSDNFVDPSELVETQLKTMDAHPPKRIFITKQRGFRRKESHQSNFPIGKASDDVAIGVTPHAACA